MTREEWKNYREFDRMRLEMNGGAGRRPDPAAAETAAGRTVAGEEKDARIVQG